MDAGTATDPFAHFASQGENWEDEQLDGKPFQLPEPPEGVIWTREDYRLPETGVLSVKYRPTKRVPRMEQVIDEPMFEALVMMMQDKHVTDQGCLLRENRCKVTNSCCSVLRVSENFCQSDNFLSLADKNFWRFT